MLHYVFNTSLAASIRLHSSMSMFRLYYILADVHRSGFLVIYPHFTSKDDYYNVKETFSSFGFQIMARESKK